jgi:DNA-binding NtrC family response regulator
VVAERLPDGPGTALIAERPSGLQRWATIVLCSCDDSQGCEPAPGWLTAGAVELPEGDLGALLDAIDTVAASRWRISTGVAGAAAGTTPGAPAPAERIIGQAASIQKLRAGVRRIAPIPVDVLLIGETGSGKDLVLQQLHALSGRPGPLVALNCGAIPDTLFESELFGHEAGAFTGATKGRPGSFEQAHTGTLFLDEIDSMPMNQQVKLLRVLETRRVARVGGGRELELDLRVVAATQGRLLERCKQGLFRLDLWNRLNVVALDIPALRHRRDDVIPLFQHFVDDACARFHVERSALPPADAGRLLAYGWPGNVRELKHAAERFVLGVDVLPDDAQASDQPQELASQLALCERELIKTALDRHESRLAAVAVDLGISEKTLTRRISAFRLGTPRHGTPQ